MNLNIYNINNIHFIGIGGLFISSLPFFFLNINKNIKITGSEIEKNKKIIIYLKKNNIKIYIGHSKNNINDKINLIIYSSSIDLLNNPEILEAKKFNIPIYSKKDIIKYICNIYDNVISICGSHGKTTISCTLIYILKELNINVNYILGGYLNDDNVNFNFIKDKKILILESDESDLTFKNVNCKYFVLNNIDNDHLNNYNNSLNNIIKSFIEYINNNNFLSLLCLDDKNIKKNIKNIKNKKIITYGFNKNSNFRIVNKFLYKNNSKFSIIDKINKKKYYINIKNCFGYFNIINTTSSFIIILLLKNIINLSIKKAIKSLKKFIGIKRRFEILNSYNLLKKINKNFINVLIINDYGHHPNEINNVIHNIKNVYKNKRIIIIFQPHRYSRTYILFKNFIRVLLKIDILIILDIYPANENNTFNINSYDLYHELKKNKKKVFYIKNKFLNCILKVLKCIIKNNDIILIQGAGSISEYIIKLFNE